MVALICPVVVTAYGSSARGRQASGGQLGKVGGNGLHPHRQPRLRASSLTIAMVTAEPVRTTSVECGGRRRCCSTARSYRQVGVLLAPRAAAWRTDASVQVWRRLDGEVAAPISEPPWGIE